MSDVLEIDASNGSKQEKFSNRWWTFPKEEMFKHVFGTVKTLETKQSYRTQDNIKNARLYADLEVLGTYAGLYTGTPDVTLSNRLSLNIVQACTDTVTSKIAKTKPRPMFLTEDGNYALRTKAEKLTKFIDGQFDAMNHYETKQDTFRDQCIFGTGATKFYIDWARKKICSERVVIEEILVDDAEAIYGRPQSLYQRRLVNKDILIDMFPKDANWIKDATAELKDGVANSPMVQDMVKVIEGWHLKSGPEATDGVHTICIGNRTLQAIPWKHEFFPFDFERWNKPIVGFFGIGIPRELTGIQVEINKILRSIQLSMHLFAVPRLMTQSSSVITHINNDIASIIKYSGTVPPAFITPQAMSPDVYNHLWYLYAKGFEKVGVSQLSATSQKPEGLDSGAAIREYTDVESDRFQIVGQRRELSFLTDAKITIELAKELSAKDGDFKVKISDQGSMKVLRFSDVNMEEEKYLMRVFPASILPTQPAAKMQTIVEWTQAGFFEKDDAMDLMDFPDLKAATSRLLSPQRIVLKMLDQMVEDGKYQPPEPLMDLPLTQRLSQYYYLKAKQDGVPESRLDLIRNFIEQCVSIQMQATAVPPGGAPMPMPGGGAPTDPAAAEAGATPAMAAVPEAPPTNPMLPQG